MRGSSANHAHCEERTPIEISKDKILDGSELFSRLETQISNVLITLLTIVYYDYSPFSAFFIFIMIHLIPQKTIVLTLFLISLKKRIEEIKHSCEKGNPIKRDQVLFEGSSRVLCTCVVPLVHFSSSILFYKLQVKEYKRITIMHVYNK